ncbi:MAG: hypothetical protein HRT45_05365 [Bdellovibrionales bacterium]|nr:hypothetical protein [Bdellovibrionales bacterium]
MKIAVSILLTSLIMPSQSGLAEGLNGSEWTFTNDRMLNAENTNNMQAYQIEVIAKWLQRIAAQCASCSVNLDKSEFTLEGDLTLNVFPDNRVLEWNITAATSTRLRSYEELLQRLIWDTAKGLGLSPHERIGGGHITLDSATHFAGDELLERNFLADTLNHPELSIGGLGLVNGGAKPAAVLEPHILEAIAAEFSKFDEGLIDIHKLRDNIDTHYAHSEVAFSGNKNHAMNLVRRGRTELRAIKPQTSMRQYLAILDLIEGRIAYLKKFRQPIPLQVPDYRSLYRFHRDEDFKMIIENKVPAQLIVNVFARYVIESGQDWNDFRNDLADPRLIGLRPQGFVGSLSASRKQLLCPAILTEPTRRGVVQQ